MWQTQQSTYAGAKLAKLRYGVFTCSSWAWGYFNAYDYASQLDLDCTSATTSMARTCSD
jgi:phosphodiesterase/alkaline phosphatase D-like protein